MLKDLKCTHTNADQLRNKMTELETRLREFLPHIIGITEVKPKNISSNVCEAEFNLSNVGNYYMFSRNLDNNIGRGIILYVDKQLPAVEVHMDTKFEEHVFVSIALNKSESALIGLIYRSPSGTDSNNQLLIDIMNEASNLGHTHVLIMGDFNLPDTDWETWSTTTSNSIDQRFIECMQDNFLYQCVDQPTRWRGTDKPRILDLLVTKDANFISSLDYQSPLGKSDHCVMNFRINCVSYRKDCSKQRRCYDKADYSAMRTHLQAINWSELLNVEDIDKAWSVLMDTVKKAENIFVPLKTIKTGTSKKKFFPLDQDVLDLIKNKNRLSRKISRNPVR